MFSHLLAVGDTLAEKYGLRRHGLVWAVLLRWLNEVPASNIASKKMTWNCEAVSNSSGFKKFPHTPQNMETPL
jgi:hypothetical protein